jgi:hypothetical protein
VQERREQLKNTEFEIEEAEVPKVPTKVYSPSADEYDKHCATHLPYRNWCPICVQAKKKNPPHRHNGKEDMHKHIPVISMDYMFMNEKGDDDNNPILVVHDGMSEGVWAILAKKKGESAYVQRRIVELIKRLGYSKIVIKSDQEPAICEVERKAREQLMREVEECSHELEKCGFQLVVQHSPVGESAANGAIENAIQRVQGQIRAIKLDVEINSKVKLTPTHVLWPWLIEYAAQTLLYWRISGEDGLTTIQRIRGRSTMSPKPRFGEHVMYKVPKTVKMGKSEARWRPGVWIGSIETSDEHLVGTDLGVI